MSFQLCPCYAICTPAKEIEDCEIIDIIESRNGKMEDSVGDSDGFDGRGKQLGFSSGISIRSTLLRDSSSSINLSIWPQYLHPTIQETQPWRWSNNAPNPQCRMNSDSCKFILAHQIDKIVNQAFTHDRCDCRCVKLIIKLGQERIHQQVVSILNGDLCHLLETEKLILKTKPYGIIRYATISNTSLLHFIRIFTKGFGLYSYTWADLNTMSLISQWRR